MEGLIEACPSTTLPPRFSMRKLLRSASLADQRNGGRRRRVISRRRRAGKQWGTILFGRGAIFSAEQVKKVARSSELMRLRGGAKNERREKPEPKPSPSLPPSLLLGYSNFFQSRYLSGRPSASGSNRDRGSTIDDRRSTIDEGAASRRAKEKGIVA